MKSMFGSVLVKLAGLLIAMGATTAVAVALGIWVLTELNGSIRSMKENVLPEIRNSLDVARLTTSSSDALARLSKSHSTAELDQRGAEYLASIDALAAAAALLTSETGQEILPRVQELGPVGVEVRESLRAQLQAQATLAAEMQGFKELSAQLYGRLEEISDDSVFELALQGETTSDAVIETLSAVTETFVPKLQTVLATRAEFNLAIGAVLAYLETRDSAYQQILQDLLVASSERLQSLTTDLAETDVTAETLAPLQQLATDLSAFVDSGFRRVSGLRQKFFALRQAGDTATSTMVDDLTFELLIVSEDAATTTQTTIQDMIDAQITQVVDGGELQRTVQLVFFEALLASSATEANAVLGAQAALNEYAAALSSIAESDALDADLRELLTSVVGFVDPEMGLLVSKLAALEAQEVMEATSIRAAKALTEISGLSGFEGNRSIDAALRYGETVLTSAQDARAQMVMTGGVSVVLLLGLLALAWLLILRPLARLTRVTRRLSTGDLDPVEGFERTGGEIGAMAEALSVFRNGMIEQRQMEEKERIRAKEALAEERRRQEEALRKEKEAAELAEREAAEKRAREAKVQEEKRRAAEEAQAEKARQDEEIRRKKEELDAERRAEEQAQQAEREARAAELRTVVEGLGDALSRLSDGDLTAQIDAGFPEEFEDLRLNFNSATENLAGLITRIVETSERVSNSSSEIAKATDGLAKIGEANANHLAETRSDIQNLDEVAKSSAGLAEGANTQMTSANEQAEVSKSTVQAAVSMMAEIEASSEAISNIVDLIDEVSFQTNLLALNAGVEAARAGEQGKGFAVVATEVRALATRSSEAASEINTLINQTREKISRGASGVAKAGEAIMATLKFIQSVSGSVNEIADGSRSQANTISGVNVAIERLESASQTAAAGLEESLATAEDLRSEATALKSMAAKFNVTPTEPHRPEDHLDQVA